MRITLLTYGSRGDVEPFVALAAGLSQAGHTVRLAAPEVYAGLATPYQLDYHPLIGDPDRLVAGLVQEAGQSWLGMVRVLSRFVLPLARQVYLSAIQACREAQLVVHSFLFTNGGHEIAMQRGIPDISAQLFPVFSPTREFPGVTALDLPLEVLYRRLTHSVITQIFWQGSRLVYSRVRRSDPALPPLSGWPFASRARRPTPILYAFSPQVVPPPRDWDASRLITGYWFLDAPQEPHPKLVEFLSTGPPPVYIGFGSTIARDAPRLARLALDALERCGQRGVLASGRGGLAAEELPASVCAVEAVPHGWLFPRMSGEVLAWSASEDSPAAKLVGNSLRPGWAAFGACASPALHRLPVESLEAMLAACDPSAFARTPTWDGLACESTSFTRQAKVRLILEATGRFGNGLLARTLARMVEIKSLVKGLRCPAESGFDFPSLVAGGQGIGMAQVEASRGRLIHRVALEKGRVKDYRILAPTEWNFHPKGLVRNALFGVSVSAVDEFQAKVLALLRSIDPCVQFDVSFVEEI